MLSGITEMGLVGMTAVGATAAEADEVFVDAGARLREEAQVALEPQSLG
jgi:tetrahydromethanopterin S-methyltransferase subunit E